jgi:hypothetical protein
MSPSSPTYPIPVKRLTKEQALCIVCEQCHWQTDIGPEDIRNDENYGCPKCKGPAVYKYVEADFECPACGRLHFERTPYGDGSCSRVCHLQAEYLKELAARNEVAA